jgi:hypothetical protein
MKKVCRVFLAKTQRRKEINLSQKRKKALSQRRKGTKKLISRKNAKNAKKNLSIAKTQRN